MDSQTFRQKAKECDPEKFADLSRKQLEGYLEFFLEASHVNSIEINPEFVRKGIERLRAEIAARRREERTESRHQENQTLGQKTLFWAKVGGIAAVIGTIAVLLPNIHISKFLPSTDTQASPRSFPQAPTVAAVPSQSPTATESPSETSPKPTTPAQVVPTVPPPE